VIGQERRTGQGGFTLPEVLVAGSILIVLCVGTLSVFTYVSNINRGNNLRMQALSVLQYEVEYYRGLKFVPDSATRSAELNGINRTNLRTRTSADGQVFNIWVTIDNDPTAPNVQTNNNDTTKFKEIKIEAIPQNPGSWQQNLRTDVTIQRVRSN